MEKFGHFLGKIARGQPSKTVEKSGEKIGIFYVFHCKLKHFLLKIARGWHSKTLQKSGEDIGILGVFN